MPLTHPAKADLSVKAFVLRAYINELKVANLFEVVLGKVDPGTRQVLLDPPPGSSWIDSRHTDGIGEVASEIIGLQRWRKISHDAVINSMIPVLRVVVEGFVRLFGATPATLLARLTRITSTSQRGVEYDYQASSNRSGVLIVRYYERRDVPLSTFYSCAGGIDTIFDICHTPGTIGDPQRIDDGKGNAVRIEVKW
jgi:hypothetical protein